jgi:hypothetical protein
MVVPYVKNGVRPLCSSHLACFYILISLVFTAVLLVVVAGPTKADDGQVYKNNWTQTLKGPMYGDGNSGSSDTSVGSNPQGQTRSRRMCRGKIICTRKAKMSPLAVRADCYSIMGAWKYQRCCTS